MTKQQRYRYEMFVRVRDFGAANADLFPESSSAGRTLARVTAAVSTIDEHMKNHVLGKAEARRVKAATRAAVVEYMKTIALAARRVTRREPGENPFRLPTRRTLAAEIATARAFLQAAEARPPAFVAFGLPPTFIGEFRRLVDELQQAVAVRLSSKTVRRHARAGIQTAVAQGFDAVQDLDAMVAIATRQDPTRHAAWQAARRVEGQGASALPAITRPVLVATPPPALPAPVHAETPGGHDGPLLVPEDASTGSTAAPTPAEPDAPAEPPADLLRRVS